MVMPVPYSVTVSVTVSPVKVWVRWVESPLEPVAPFHLMLPGQTRPPALDALISTYWGSYFENRTDPHEPALQAVLEHPALAELPPPKDWQYPHLEVSAPLDAAVRDEHDDTLPALEGFRRLWRALPRGLPAFREAVVRLVPRMGLLRPFDLRRYYQEYVQLGGLEIREPQYQDSLAGWVGATLEVFFWRAALQADNAKVTDFLQSWGADLSGFGNWGNWVRRLLNPPEEERLFVTLTPLPVAAAARVILLHQGRTWLSGKRIRGFLREQGLSGLMVPGPVWPGKQRSPTAAFAGAYHLALLELARRTPLRACQYCGTPIQGERSTRRFCDATCRQAYNRQRKRELQ